MPPLMQPPHDQQFRRIRWALLYILFAVALFLTLAFWALAGQCENDCAGPPSTANKLAYLILGVAFILSGGVVQWRWSPIFGTLVWMIGAVLLFHALLVTFHPTT